MTAHLFFHSHFLPCIVCQFRVFNLNVQSRKDSRSLKMQLTRLYWCPKGNLNPNGLAACGLLVRQSVLISFLFPVFRGIHGRFEHSLSRGIRDFKPHIFHTHSGASQGFVDGTSTWCSLARSPTLPLTTSGALRAVVPTRMLPGLQGFFSGLHN